MKKSIVAMLSITALATVANAETLHTGTDFEGTTGTNLFWATHNDSGTQAGETFYWYATNYVEQSSVDQSLGVYTNYETVVDNNTRYLSLDTEGNRVCRTIDSRQNCTAAPSSRPIFGTIYFDSLVQFTVNEDDEPTMQEGDKLAVWLKGDEENHTTNLVITAGYVHDGLVDASNYVVQTSSPVLPGNWYRLTIDAIPLIDGATSDMGYLGFRVRIDGNYVTTTDSKGSVQDAIDGWADDCGGTSVDVTSGLAGLFPSLIAGGQGTTDCAALSCVGFEGTGAIDNLLFTDEDPAAPAVPTVDGNAPADGDAFIAAATSGTANILPNGWTLDGNVIKDGNNATYATIPAFYTATLTDGTLTLVLNTTALPTIGAANVTVGEETEAKEAIEVGDTKFTATLTGTEAKLYYGLSVATTPNPANWPVPASLTKGTGSAMQLTAAKPVDGSTVAPAAFFKVYVTDIAPTGE